MKNLLQIMAIVIVPLVLIEGLEKLYLKSN